MGLVFNAGWEIFKLRFEIFKQAVYNISSMCSDDDCQSFAQKGIETTRKSVKVAAILLLGDLLFVLSEISIDDGGFWT